MDIDAYAAVHAPTWRRLEVLVARPGKLRGAELDELVELYQRTSTHLAVLTTRSSDPVLVGRLTALVARARGVVTGRKVRSWAGVGTFLTVTFPAVAYRCRWWWLAVSVITILVSTAEAAWIINSRHVQQTLLPASEVHQLVSVDFAGYYHAAPHSSFAAQVWTNNALVAAQCLLSGLLFGVPVLYLLALTAFAQLGPSAGYLIANGHGGQFFALILPHGLLELSCVFLAAGAGLRLGWTIIAPGPRSRMRALQVEGRATATLAGGLTIGLFVSGMIEGFVTPSGIPPIPRVGIGVVAWGLFLAWVLILGRRAVRNGIDGDLSDRSLVAEEG